MYIANTLPNTNSNRREAYRPCISPFAWLGHFAGPLCTAGPLIVRGKKTLSGPPKPVGGKAGTFPSAPNRRAQVRPRVEAEVPNAPATACSSLSWVDGWRTVLCLAAERVLFCTFSHLGFILHARYAWSIGDDASRYSAPDPGILPLHGPLHSRLESVLLSYL